MLEHNENLPKVSESRSVGTDILGKKIITAIILSLLLIIIGCGKKEEVTEGIEIEFWHGLGGPIGDALDEMVNEFNKTHPQITVKAISMGRYEALSQKLMAAIAAGTQPELAQTYESWTTKFIKGDAIVPMEDFVNGPYGLSPEEIDDIYPVFIKSSTIDGKLWQFPFNKSVRVMYYNKDRFYQVGLDTDKPPRTWTEFTDVCKKLTEDKDKDGIPEKYGTSFSLSVWQFENLLLQAGGEIMNEDNTKVMFNSAAGIKALNFLNDLLNKYKVAYLSTGYDWQNDFLSGKVGIVEGTSVSLAYMKKGGIHFHFGVAPIPYDKTKRSVISGTNVVIFRNEKDPKSAEKQKAAWEFIKWFTSPKQTAKWSLLTYYMPVRRSALQDERMQKRFAELPGLKGIYEQLDYATVEPQIEAWYLARKYLSEHVLEKVIRGQLTPKQALENAERQMMEYMGGDE